MDIRNISSLLDNHRLRLGFHYHTPAAVENGQVVMPSPIGVFVESLASYCKDVICFCHSPRDSQLKSLDFTVSSPNVVLVDLGKHKSVPYRVLFSNKYCQKIKKYQTSIDALLIRGPSPLLPFVAKAVPNIPVVLLLVGNYMDVIEDLPQPLVRKSIIRQWAKWNQVQQTAVAKKSLTFVNSRKLYLELKGVVSDLHEINTTTLSSSDFFERDDTCTKSPYHILFTGRVDRSKGLMNILLAFIELIKNGEDLVLDIVGPRVYKDDILEEMVEVAKKNGVEDRLIYHGAFPIGPNLFQFYKDADIFLTASKAAEGFPRSIWEALAHSLPVVATSVGAIPYYLQNENTALIVSPNNVGEIVRAVTKVIHEPDLRCKLIQNGRMRVLNNTLEKRSEELVTEINTWLHKQSLDTL